MPKNVSWSNLARRYCAWSIQDISLNLTGAWEFFLNIMTQLDTWTPRHEPHVATD